MIITNVRLLELRDKHYETQLLVDIQDSGGFSNSLSVSVSGYYPQPSDREIDKGWEPDYGMDHVENQAEYEIALLIKEALEKGFK